MTKPPALKEPTNLSEKAYRHILSEILDARLAAGTPIQERRIAEEIGVSRSPLRDALGRLAGEGLLVRGNTGILAVRALSLQDYLQTLEMRALVEPAAASLAATAVAAADIARLETEMARLETTDDLQETDLLRFDDDLHAVIASYCSNPFMMRYLQDMRRYTTLYERQTKWWATLHVDNGEHREILTALALRAPEQAADAMRRHLSGIRRRVLQRF